MIKDTVSRDADELAEALKPRGCGSCGGFYGSASAYTVHFEQGEGSRCLPGDAHGQLEQVDGVWVLPWSDTARR